MGDARSDIGCSGGCTLKRKCTSNTLTFEPDGCTLTDGTVTTNPPECDKFDEAYGALTGDQRDCLSLGLCCIAGGMAGEDCTKAGDVCPTQGRQSNVGFNTKMMTDSSEKKAVVV